MFNPDVFYENSALKWLLNWLVSWAKLSSFNPCRRLNRKWFSAWAICRPNNFLKSSEVHISVQKRSKLLAWCLRLELASERLGRKWRYKWWVSLSDVNQLLQGKTFRILWINWPLRIGDRSVTLFRLDRRKRIRYHLLAMVQTSRSVLQWNRGCCLIWTIRSLD